jgi:hypothetical protein
MRLATYEEGDIFVSTVFIGQCNIIFETMVFGGERDGYTDRYKTRAGALAGHEATVALVKAAQVEGEHK